MPARRSGGSTDEPTERRTSLRRLSSLASLHNLFARRRSNPAGANTTSTLPSSSSNLSLQSTVANPPVPAKRQASTLHLSLQSPDARQDAEEDTNLQLHRKPTPGGRPSSYICLSDDRSGGRPRGRTSSQLPMPTRPSRAIPTEHAKFAVHRSSVDQDLQTRLPTPPASSRRFAHSRLVSAERLAPLLQPRTRVQRSDTEPLLNKQAPNRKLGSGPRSTAFKENISLSPIKRLPVMSSFGDVEGGFGPVLAELAGDIGNERRQQDDASLEMSLHAPLVNLSPNRSWTKPTEESQSSPGYRKLHEQRYSPKHLNESSLPRWTSQPSLTNVTNRRISQHGEIKQTRLMSALQAPTPPPVQSSPKMTAPTASQSRTRTEFTSRLLQWDSQSHEAPRSPDQCSATTSPRQNRSSLQISTAEPPAYWSGRLSSLADQYRNSELAAHLAGGSTNKCESDKLHASDATVARLRQALARLHELCTTPEAHDSLAVFQRQFGEAMRMPDLAGSSVSNEIAVAAAAGCEKGAGGGREAGQAQTFSEVRKIKFMDRLLGRQKRRSLVLG